ncbi:S41 family peptidase [Paenibacillus sp. Leaf72]|uniref:S41 family peptidase n=1 Tax=Paenibacillus sp. Leaf72 TaxID=1736234 RepID=UPI0006FC4066|nr:S41 family peptidase [Paenibacillus sp. Leaf72]KQO11029.1 peptidase S41 [Paenibacillus sp. Leaf72]
MQFRGRTVIAFVMITMLASVLVTLVVARDLVVSSYQASGSAPAAAETSGQHDLNEAEIDKMNAVLDLIETKYVKKTDREELVDGAVKGMLESLDDPYSVYMEKTSAQHFSESIEGSFTGIGAEVTLQNGKLVVVSPIKGSPAERAGLLAKDVVISVNGEKLEGLGLNEAVDKIRGPKGTKAKLQIQRVGTSESIQLILIRDDIDVETVYAHLSDDRIGVIEIRQFSLNTAERFKEELARLEQEAKQQAAGQAQVQSGAQVSEGAGDKGRQGLKGLVIDVRNNPGGVLPVVVEIAEQFIAKGSAIVQVEDRDGKREKTLSKGSRKAYPVAVVMNKGSASASEILAGALGEEAGAILVGETTFGKGTVQVSYNKALGDGSLVKMTIAKWLTPEGIWIHEKGVEPTVAVAPPSLYTVARLTITETLKRDMNNEQIRSAQIMLKGLGYEPKRDDGYFNEETVQAVKQFQRNSSLPVTGELDKSTAAALEKAVIAWIKDKNNDVQLREAIERVGRK